MKYTYANISLDDFRTILEETYRKKLIFHVDKDCFIWSTFLRLYLISLFCYEDENNELNDMECCDSYKYSEL